MSKLFEHVPPDVSSAHNEQRDPCRSPLYLSRGKIRGKPATGDPIFYARSFVRPALQSTALYLLVIVIAMMAMVKPAQASGTVTSTLNTYYVSGNGFGYYRTAASPDAVCSGYVVTQLSPTRWQCTYTYTSNDGVPPSYWGTQYIIYAQYISPVCPANSSGATTCTCIDPYVPDDAGASCILLTCDTGYKPDPTGTSCVPVVTCPAHASGNPCVCDAGYKFDATGKSCVPEAVCTAVTKLDDITDPVAKLYEDGTYSSTNPDIEHLTPETLAGLACIKQKVIATNCNRAPQATSGYRPAAYQTHIYDVYFKWQQIMNNDTPECAEVKAAIEKEFRTHSRFDHAPGETSNHSRTDAQGNPAGIAVDIAFVPDNALISADAIACQCNMSRTVPNDAVHYQPRACPR